MRQVRCVLSDIWFRKLTSHIQLLSHLIRYPSAEESFHPMGADWVCLFNKRLCDEIPSLTPTNIPVFVQLHLPALHEFSDFKCGFEQDVPASVRLVCAAKIECESRRLGRHHSDALVRDWRKIAISLTRLRGPKDPVLGQ